MEMIADFLLLAASGVATIYCFVLSRRLARLSDMKNGIGASIASMSETLDQTQKAIALAKSSSLESVAKLVGLLEEAERIKPEISQLVEALSEIAVVAAEDIDAARHRAIMDIASERNAGVRKAAAPGQATKAA